LVAGQNLAIEIGNGNLETFFLLIENDGEGDDRILAGSSALHTRHTRVECHELGNGTTRDITGEIFANRYEENYRQGESRLVRVRVKNLSALYRRSFQKKGLIRVNSTVEPRARDLGSTGITLEPAVPPVRQTR
jgi:hypothetical protein